jgi:hypothetical protein
MIAALRRLARRMHFAQPFYVGLKNVLGLPRHVRAFFRYRELLRDFPGRPVPSWNDLELCTSDDTVSTAFDRHYLFHVAWAARKLQALGPKRHVDIGSSLYLNAAVSAFLPIEFYDFRPPAIDFPGLTCGAADLMRLAFPDGSVPSLSCLHVLEHIGLGRYGDTLNPDGDRIAAAELRRVLAPGGNLLIVVPVGRPRVCYNAHRVYAYEQVRELFFGLDVVEFSLITDQPSDTAIQTNAPPEACLTQSFGCGCFHFWKGEA